MRANAFVLLMLVGDQVVTGTQLRRAAAVVPLPARPHALPWRHRGHEPVGALRRLRAGARRPHPITPVRPLGLRPAPEPIRPWAYDKWATAQRTFPKKGVLKRNNRK